MDISITGCLNYVGQYDNSKEYNYLDCCVRNDSIWGFDGTRNWTAIGSGEYYSHEEKDITTQCRNCGAPTYENGQCPYCGTINKKVRKFNAR